MKIKDVEYSELAESPVGRPVLPANLQLLKHVEVKLEVKIGQVSLTVEELFALRAGSQLKLDRLVDEPVDILLNGQVIAAGQLAVMGEHLGVRVTEVRNSETELPR
jgi:flagellar motor switch protein FliN